MNAVNLVLKRIIESTAVYERGRHNGLKKLDIIKPSIKCSLYDFRHTFATKQAENGLPINSLAELMGHREITTTSKYYVGLTDKMMNKAMNIMSDKSAAIL